jgi:hypothetical protein
MFYGNSFGTLVFLNEKLFKLFFHTILLVRGVYLMQFSDSEKQDYITIENNVYLHKQIETKGNIVFMRMKKRVLKE